MELYNAPNDRKLLYLYLANDILQGSRKKGNEFIKEFSKIIKAAVIHIFSAGDKDTQQAVLRTLGVWEERKVFPINFVQDIKKSVQEVQGIPVHISPSSLKEEPQLPTALLEPPKTNVNSHIGEILQQIESGEIANALLTEKIASIRTDLFENDLSSLLEINSENANIDELISEIEEAYGATFQYKNDLEADRRRRASLVSLLEDFLAKQDNALTELSSKIALFTKHLSHLKKLKNEIQNLETFEKKQTTELNAEISTSEPIFGSENPVLDLFQGISKRQKLSSPFQLQDPRLQTYENNPSSLLVTPNSTTETTTTTTTTANQIHPHSSSQSTVIPSWNALPNLI